LIAFFVVGEPYGTLNDVSVVVQYLLAMPMLVALHTVLVRRAPRLSIVAAGIGLIGIIAVVALQLLLITKALTFAQQSVPVSVALFVGVGGWIVLVGCMSRTTGAFRNTIALALAGWSYVGYPVWAFAVGRQLASLART
jgi:hypothetical protein